MLVVSRIITFLGGFYVLMWDYSLILEFELLRINSVSIVITILLDWISLLFIRFVLFISSIVIYYREGYISGDININRFIMLVFIFVLSIILLIIRPNLVRILLGWDGLGLVSYCLVIYYQNIKSYNAGIITALRNRVGDVALLMAIAWIISYGSFNYIYYTDYIVNSLEINIVVRLVILAAITKRAQIPFSSWLPAAIAAPTPVSSLVHSSTLVTAGVYLLIRFYRAITMPIILFLLFIGTITIFMAGLGANFEFDLKKIIALSTLRQLGLMIAILALGEYKLAFFHLLTHALFKALLFICAGCIIHNLGNFQDIRYMGGFVVQLPLTCSFFIISNLSLCGLPFLSGFYSKDLLLEVVSISYLNIYIYLIFFISIGLTVCYTFRLLYYVLIGDYNCLSLRGIRDRGDHILKGMIGLIFLVIMGGSILIWLIFPTPYFICLPPLMKMMALVVIFGGIWVGYEFSKFSLTYQVKALSILKTRLFLSSIWNIPFISTYGVNFYPIYAGKLISNSVDQGWSEYAGSQRLYFSLKTLSVFLQILHNNNLKIFILLLVMWVLFILLLF